MEWWQSLLISLIPAVIAGFVSWLVSHQQMKNTKKEFVLRCDLENKQYITKARFDMEFSIYKELSEKVLEMVRYTSDLFPQGLYQEPQEKEERLNYRKNKYESARISYNEANTSIRKYAVFIPEEFYKKFCSIRELCYMQLNWYPDFQLGTLDSGVANELKEERSACWRRTKEISEALNLLVVDLRAYLEKLDVKANDNPIEVEKKVLAHSLAKSTITGLFERK